MLSPAIQRRVTILHVIMVQKPVVYDMGLHFTFTLCTITIRVIVSSLANAIYNAPTHFS